MSVVVLLENVFNYTIGLVIDFIDGVLYANTGNNLSGYNFKLGFGSIEWVNIDLYTLFYLIGSVTIGIVFILLVWKVFKFFTKLTRKAFGKW